MDHPFDVYRNAISAPPHDLVCVHRGEQVGTARKTPCCGDMPIYHCNNHCYDVLAAVCNTCPDYEPVTEKKGDDG